jgi:hypothetical protein
MSSTKDTGDSGEKGAGIATNSGMRRTVVCGDGKLMGDFEPGAFDYDVEVKEG